MLKESILDKTLYKVKKLIPKSIFNFFQRVYHGVLAYAVAPAYGIPSRKLKVIGVTGTKGKSTVVYLVSKIFEKSGKSVAACGSLGYKIKDKEWPNTLKMTMPGRFRLHKLMAEAVKAGCEHFLLEVTYEAMKKNPHLGIQFDCAVFTNLHKEHIESHGSFEKYFQAKQELFKITKNIHVINAEDSNFELFSKFPSRHTIYYGSKKSDLAAGNVNITSDGSHFEIFGTEFNTKLIGEFNILNSLAALSVGVMYGIDLPTMKPALESIDYIPGRMQFVQRKPFAVIIDYAHTPESLKKVYQTLKSQISNPKSQTNSKFQIPNKRRLICVLGAAGGGRDKWKRPEFGRIASQYCDEVILTNEDPYDENPETIIEDIKKGFPQLQTTNYKLQTILDRKEAIKKAIYIARQGDIVVITGKGSEISMVLVGGAKIPWSDWQVVSDFLNK